MATSRVVPPPQHGLPAAVAARVQWAGQVPLLRLNTGAMMPMLSIGTGAASRGKRGRKKRAAPGSVRGFVNASLQLGFRAVDAAEVYPLFDEVGEGMRLAGVPRRELFVTSKVDPTRKPGRRGATCAADGAGCFDAMSSAANSTVARLGTHVDLLLLHRPPKLEGDTLAQCRRLRESWRALEDAQRRGLARAIGLSNCCAQLLTCVAATATISPAAVQYMHHVGMGADALGYRRFVERTWGAAYMGYSVLGGVEGDFGKIVGAPLVRRIASAHGTHGANVALSWVAQLGMPFVVLSSNPDHLRDDLGVFARPPWGLLSAEEMAQLSALDAPSGRPSHWGDCRDAPLL
jgi:diketogulonate reductase-like aldo/keto reductase